MNSGLLWSSKPADQGGEISVGRKLGVMFVEDYGPYGPTAADTTVNVRTTRAAIVDGLSNTILLSENTLAGAGPPSPYSKSVETNWATPMANFCLFIGSDDICPADGQCYQGGLMPQGGKTDGPMWAMANSVGTHENINYGQNLSVKGSFPFSSSGHPGGLNMVFTDGAARFIQSTIDGTVYSKLLTPAGSRLPNYARQLPLSQDAFAW